MIGIQQASLWISETTRFYLFFLLGGTDFRLKIEERFLRSKACGLGFNKRYPRNNGCRLEFVVCPLGGEDCRSGIIQRCLGGKEGRLGFKECRPKGEACFVGMEEQRPEMPAISKGGMRAPPLNNTLYNSVLIAINLK